MARFKFSSVSKIASTRDSVAWGKINFEQNSTLVFAALLIVCSLAVGCSSEKPKTESSNSPVMAQPMPPVVNGATSTPVTPVAQAEPKPVHKKTVRRAPVTATYVDKSSGVSLQYPKKYTLKTGEEANKLVSEDSAPMSFVQPGGVAVAAVAIPEGAYPKSDLAAAFFDVSVNKSLTAEQCGEFSHEAPTPTPASTADGTVAPPAPASASTPTPGSKLMIGDMELKSFESLASVGTGKEDSKYYHVFENGACYEFALKVATTGVETDEGGKHVDRDEVFKRLGRILAKVKISPVSTPEVTASAPVAAPVTPAQ